MTEPKFTKGPWKACCGKRPDARCGLVFGDDGQVFVARAYSPVDLNECDPVPHYEQATANKHLIAAAPELYGALEELLRYFDEATRRNPYSYQEVKADARKALAKARGEVQNDS